MIIKIHNNNKPVIAINKNQQKKNKHFQRIEKFLQHLLFVRNIKFFNITNEF